MEARTLVIVTTCRINGELLYLQVNFKPQQLLEHLSIFFLSTVLLIIPRCILFTTVCNFFEQKVTEE